jgi:hypothetical protein
MERDIFLFRRLIMSSVNKTNSVDPTGSSAPIAPSHKTSAVSSGFDSMDPTDPLSIMYSPAFVAAQRDRDKNVPSVNQAVSNVQNTSAIDEDPARKLRRFGKVQSL